MVVVMIIAHLNNPKTHNNLKAIFLFLPLPRGKLAIFRAELGKKLIN